MELNGSFSLTNCTSNDTCNVSHTLQDRHDVHVFYAVFIPTLCFLITFGNMGTIFAFWKLPSLREKPSELLILSLSCADLITGMIVIPLFSPVYVTPGNWPFKEVTCRIFIFFMDLAVHASLFSLCMISMDRFLLVYKEYPQYVKIQSHLRIKTSLAIGWTFSLITGLIEFFMWDVAKTLDETALLIDYTKHCLSPPRRMRSFALPFFLTLYFFPVVLVCSLSASIFYRLHQRLNTSWGMRADSQLSKTSNATQDTSAHKAMTAQLRNRYIKPAVTLLVLVSAMAVCMLPYCVHVIVVEVFCTDCANNHTLYALILFQFCNAALDPLMYALTQKKIQRFYKARLKMLTRKTVPLSNRSGDQMQQRHKLAISSNDKTTCNQI